MTIRWGEMDKFYPSCIPYQNRKKKCYFLIRVELKKFKIMCV
jgi:hypothetical protein